jgi:hypothetical protein
MNADIINEVRAKVGSVVRDRGCLEIIWDVAPMEPKDEMFCTGLIRDNGRELIATCGNSYDFQENGIVEIIAYMKRGEGDLYLREKIDEIRFYLEQSETDNVQFDNMEQDVPLEAEQTQYAILMRLNFRTYTSRLIDQG